MICCEHKGVAGSIVSGTHLPHTYSALTVVGVPSVVKQAWQVVPTGQPDAGRQAAQVRAVNVPEVQ
jgi:hypothetical protein